MSTDPQKERLIALSEFAEAIRRAEVNACDGNCEVRNDGHSGKCEVVIVAGGNRDCAAVELAISCLVMLRSFAGRHHLPG